MSAVNTIQRSVDVSRFYLDAVGALVILRVSGLLGATDAVIRDSDAANIAEQQPRVRRC